MKLVANAQLSIIVVFTQELEQRYTRFRVEVQTALDRCEAGATYESLARRILQRENSETHALSNGAGTLSGPPKRTAPVAGQHILYLNDRLARAERQRGGEPAGAASRILVWNFASRILV